MFRPVLSTLLCACLLVVASMASAQDCPGNFSLQNHTGVGQVICPCFIVGEEAGVVLTAPVDHYPIEIVKITVTWASQFGGTPQSLEQALHLYAGGLPDPGVAIFSLPGPLLTDGFANQFDISQTPGNKMIPSGPFTVTLEFLNQNSNQIFSPTVVHDGNGCQPGKNVVRAIPGGWLDACSAGVTGDWVMSVEYRCDGATNTEHHTLSSATGLRSVQPNPFVAESRIAFSLQQAAFTKLQVFDVRGRVVCTLTNQSYAPGQHVVTWRGVDGGGDRVAPGTYFIRMDAAAQSFTEKVVLRK